MLLHFDLHKHGEVLVVCMQIEPIQPSQQRRHLLLNLLLALRISCNYASKSLLLLHSHLNEPHSHHAVKQLTIADRIAEVKQREIRATSADTATNRRLELPQVWKSHSCSRNHRYDRTVHIFESKGSLHTCKAN